MSLDPNNYIILSLIFMMLMVATVIILLSMCKVKCGSSANIYF